MSASGLLQNGRIAPYYLPNGMGHFFSTYPPNIVEQVKNASGKVTGIRSSYGGLTYSDLISRIDSLEQTVRELKTMIESQDKYNNTASEGWYSAKSSHSSRKTRKARRF